MGDYDGPITRIVSLIVLGLGLAGLFLGVEDWWLVLVLGYAVVVPIVSVLTGEEEVETGTENAESPARSGERDTGTTKRDSLETLRERYARGELTEEQFEAKVERLLATETLEDAREAVGRTTGDPRETGPRVERTRAGPGDGNERVHRPEHDQRRERRRNQEPERERDRE